MSQTTITAAPSRIVLDISGMTCAACASRVEKALNSLDGAVASVNYATERAVVSGLDDESIDTAIETVKRAGYGAHLRDGTDDLWSSRAAEAKVSSLRRRLAVSAVLTVPLMDLTLLAAFVPAARFPGWQLVALALALPVVAWAAWPFHRATLRNLRHRMVSMDSLVSLGVVVSFGWAVVSMLYGDDRTVAIPFFGLVLPPGSESVYLDVAAGLTTFQLAGRYFETRARRRAGDVLGALDALAPTEVRVLVDGVETMRPVLELRAGDVFVVRAGETIAADGTVGSGTSAVDASMMTGEPVPVEVQAGDAVVAGTVSTDGRLEVVATSVGAHTRLAQMAALTEQAQARKSHVQALVDRVVSRFVPAVIALSVLVTVVWLILGRDPFEAVGIGISVLIIACPCALGLATPTALMVGVGRAATLGILIRGQDALESARRIDTVVLDKTGTVTTGRLAPHAALAIGVPDHELWRTIAAVERGADHPVARALVEAAAAHVTDVAPVENLRTLPGRGVEGVLSGDRILIGSPSLMAAEGIALPPEAQEQLAVAEQLGLTVVLVARASTLIGVVSLADEVKPDARAAVAHLKSLGLTTVLLSGDGEAAAARVGELLGVDRVIGGVEPAKKAEIVAGLRAEGRAVAMVGDGSNDAAGLATADLGLALGSGTDMALKAADVIVVRDDVTAVADAILLARTTLATIRTNLVWALAYNVLAIPVAAAGFLNPLIAAAAMSFSSVLVVANSLRIQRVKSFR